MVRGLLAAVLGGEDYGTKDSERKPKGYWTREKINEDFYNSINKLKRIPTCREINESAFVSIKNEAIKGIKTWNQFLEYHGLETNTKRWPKERINEYFYDKINELKRVPNCDEISQGMFTSIIDGRYHPEIKTWRTFLEYHGFNVNRNIRKDYTFDNWIEELQKHSELKEKSVSQIQKDKFGLELYNDLSYWTNKNTRDPYEAKIVRQMILGRKLQNNERKSNLTIGDLGV